jgi:hypothetical protein
MTSPSMRYKLASMRQAAPFELPKARLCAAVIYALLQDSNKQALGDALEKLKLGLGASWSVILAFQFMSGRRAEFAIDCAPEDEQPYLFTAHLVAKNVCHEGALGAVDGCDGIDLAKLRSLANSLQAS